MRLLMTQRSLARLGGTELATTEITRALSARGHDVTVYTPTSGDLAKLLWSGDVRVVTELRDMGAAPDLIHGQHHLPAMAALAAFPRTPAVYHCHGGRPWVEDPPAHPGIRRYIMVCEWLQTTARARFGLAEPMLRLLPTFVNLTRFSVVREPATQLRKALVFGGDLMPAPWIAKLQKACGALGLSVDIAGNGRRDQHERPEMLLPEYDLVFATGRCAVEAMASGCAVIPLRPEQAGMLLTPANFDEWAISNFGPRYFNGAETVTTAWLRAQLTAYDPAATAAVAERVRAERNLDVAAERLEAIHAEAAAEGAGDGERPFAAYLERMAREADEIWVKSLKGARAEALQRRVERLEHELLEMHRARGLPSVRQLLAGVRRRLGRKGEGK